MTNDAGSTSDVRRGTAVESIPFDTKTDFQADARRRDPDIHSPLLQEFHRRLWTKKLPNGQMFTLVPAKVGSARVLRYQNAHDVDLELSSDTLANSHRNKLAHFYAEMGPESNAEWHRVGGSIGGRIIFPRNRIQGRQTINQRRGTHPQIRDRFDLTLEAIRRLYAGEPSPLHETLSAYRPFFELFEDFDGYVDFFLLQDLVRDNEIRFFHPFREFGKDVLPRTSEEYRSYRARQLDFVRNRNARMSALMNA